SSLVLIISLQQAAYLAACLVAYLVACLFVLTVVQMSWFPLLTVGTKISLTSSPAFLHLALLSYLLCILSPSLLNHNLHVALIGIAISLNLPHILKNLPQIGALIQ